MPKIKYVSKNKNKDIEDLVKRLKRDYPSVVNTEEYNQVFTKQNPLVSIIITTYNNSNYLINIALQSILNQTYSNLQIIVVADHSTDDTDLQMSKIKDTRIIYQNLPVRPKYPDPKANKRNFWLVAGAVPHNIGLNLSTGDFITYCDHDDSFTPDRIEKLVNFSQSGKIDFIHHPFYVGTPDKVTETYLSESLSLGKVTTSAVFHHSWFKQIPVDVNCWRLNEPGDWNKFKKFKEIGVKIERYPGILTYKG